MSESMEQRLQNLRIKHRTKGVMLDTNMLLLFVFAAFHPAMIGMKRLSAYDAAAAELLYSYVTSFDKILTTQHILAETSNLARQIISGRHWEQMCARLYPLFCIEDSSRLIQCTVQTDEIDPPLFYRLGFTDASIALTVHQRYFLLTDDLDLYIAVTSAGSDAVKFAHMREAYGQL
jgi:hypothetical protein